MRVLESRGEGSTPSVLTFIKSMTKEEIKKKAIEEFKNNELITILEQYSRFLEKEGYNVLWDCQTDGQKEYQTLKDINYAEMES